MRMVMFSPYLIDEDFYALSHIVVAGFRCRGWWEMEVYFCAGGARRVVDEVCEVCGRLELDSTVGCLHDCCLLGFVRLLRVGVLFLE